MTKRMCQTLRKQSNIVLWTPCDLHSKLRCIKLPAAFIEFIVDISDNLCETRLKAFFSNVKQLLR
jgi:hypothetical protein